MKNSKTKKAQEELVGFALIIVIVAVILLVFFSFWIKNPKEIRHESSEVESFVYTILSYTTECQDNIENKNLKEVIIKCTNKENCKNGEDSCSILTTLLNEILENSWKITNGTTKGYNLDILIGNETLNEIKQGNKTSNSRGTTQIFRSGGEEITILFDVYS